MNILNPIGMLSEFALQYGNKRRKENISPYVSTIIGATLGIDQNSPESIEQQKWMKSFILDEIRQNRLRPTKEGMLEGDVDYSDYDSSNPDPKKPAKNSLGIPVTKHGFNSPETAYQNTLGRGTFYIDPAGGPVEWKPESTKYNFNNPSNIIFKALADLVNAGGLFGILKERITGDPPELQHSIPSIEISREDLNKAFRSRHLKGHQEFSE
jgi:hypothetical protein